MTTSPVNSVLSDVPGFDVWTDLATPPAGRTALVKNIIASHRNESTRTVLASTTPTFHYNVSGNWNDDNTSNSNGNNQTRFGNQTQINFARLSSSLSVVLSNGYVNQNAPSSRLELQAVRFDGTNLIYGPPFDTGLSGNWNSGGNPAQDNCIVPISATRFAWVRTGNDVTVFEVASDLTITRRHAPLSFTNVSSSASAARCVEDDRFVVVGLDGASLRAVVFDFVTGTSTLTAGSIVNLAAVTQTGPVPVVRAVANANTFCVVTRSTNTVLTAYSFTTSGTVVTNGSQGNVTTDLLSGTQGYTLASVSTGAEYLVPILFPTSSNLLSVSLATSASAPGGSANTNLGTASSGSYFNPRVAQYPDGNAYTTCQTGVVRVWRASASTINATVFSPTWRTGNGTLSVAFTNPWGPHPSPASYVLAFGDGIFVREAMYRELVQITAAGGTIRPHPFCIGSTKRSQTAVWNRALRRWCVVDSNRIWFINDAGVATGYLEERDTSVQDMRGNTMIAFVTLDAFPNGDLVAVTTNRMGANSTAAPIYFYSGSSIDVNAVTIASATNRVSTVSMTPSTNQTNNFVGLTMVSDGVVLALGPSASTALAGGSGMVYLFTAHNDGTPASHSYVFSCSVAGAVANAQQMNGNAASTGHYQGFQHLVVRRQSAATSFEFDAAAFFGGGSNGNRMNTGVHSVTPGNSITLQTMSTANNASVPPVSYRIPHGGALFQPGTTGGVLSVSAQGTVASRVINETANANSWDQLAIEQTAFGIVVARSNATTLRIEVYTLAGTLVSATSLAIAALNLTPGGTRVNVPNATSDAQGVVSINRPGATSRSVAYYGAQTAAVDLAVLKSGGSVRVPIVLGAYTIQANQSFVWDDPIVLNDGDRLQIKTGFPFQIDAMANLVNVG